MAVIATNLFMTAPWSFFAIYDRPGQHMAFLFIESLLTARFSKGLQPGTANLATLLLPNPVL